MVGGSLLWSRLGKNPDKSDGMMVKRWKAPSGQLQILQVGSTNGRLSCDRLLETPARLYCRLFPSSLSCLSASQH